MTALALELSPPESKHYRSWSERLDHVARYSQPDEIHVACEKAHAAGATAVLAVLDARTEQALADFQRWRDLSTWVVVPNMNAFIRDLTDRGPAGAALARFSRLSPGAMLTVGLRAVRELPALARSDFSAAALWLAGMELAAARRLRISRVFLHPQLTEIALAGRLAALFTEFARRVEGLGMEAGLMTHNPVMAAEVLGGDLARFAAVVAPCNAKGYKMAPDRGACEALFRSDPGRFWATEVTAGGSIPLAEALAHVGGLGLAGSVLDHRTAF
ncbi:MAG TPA: hypothetical protein VMR21_12555 [Vicinamibacteria bacterium]|nr:hypothetical protein [Vicinamibacteria bacterium]